MTTSFFFAHGSPMIAIEDQRYTQFLRQFAQKIEKPKAIAIFTAHWESQRLTISSTDDIYETIYDFFGFPDVLYTLQYPARGSVEIATKIANLFSKQGIPNQTDATRGLDHGSWVILKHLFPQADIPVVQLSVNPFLPPNQQYAIGQAIRELPKQGVMVIGSGGTVHNLRKINWGQQEPEAWAVAFDDWLLEKTKAKDLDALFAYPQLAPNASAAVPRAEHFVPFLIAMGAGQLPEPIIHYRSYDYGSLSYLAVEF